MFGYNILYNFSFDTSYTQLLIYSLTVSIYF